MATFPAFTPGTVAVGPLGAHESVAGGARRAVERARAIGAEALQIFVKSPNRWQARPHAEQEVAAFREALAETPLPVVAHAAYLINLCSPNAETLEKSRAALLDELERCDRLGVAGLVVHPGAHLGEGEQAGLDGIARSLDAVLAARPEGSARVLLENTAGQGSVLGSRFEQLAHVISLLDRPELVGVCLDTCHAFAAGYELRDPDGYERTLEQIEATIGLDRVLTLHLNDSKEALGSGKDRHENIGRGEIGEAAFARLITDERFSLRPLILETPLGDDDTGHERDLALLRELAGAAVAAGD